MNVENYESLTKEQWGALFPDNESLISNDELRQLVSLHDQLSLDDVKTIYHPLLRYLELYFVQYHHLQMDRALFLNQPTRRTPFIIGIAGSVAVGKSTTARLLQVLLSKRYPHWKTQLVTTDGFLYSHDELEKRHLLDRKGFPESYNMEALLQFLDDVKAGRDAKAPVYSHRHYDIVPDEYTFVHQPDILIVEGINVLQNPQHEQLYVRDFFDFSIYIDADEALIQKWYLERFELLLDQAKTDPTHYYHHYAIGDRKEAMAMAENVWKSVNAKNLESYILPTKNRADLILHKSYHHQIDYLLLRKY